MQLRRGARRLDDYGRFGDELVAHLTPEEAAYLKQRGGSATRNPITGLLEFFDASGIGGPGNSVGSSGPAGTGETSAGTPGSASSGPSGGTGASNPGPGGQASEGRAGPGPGASPSAGAAEGEGANDSGDTGLGGPGVTDTGSGLGGNPTGIGGIGNNTTDISGVAPGGSNTQGRAGPASNADPGGTSDTATEAQAETVSKSFDTGFGPIAPAVNTPQFDQAVAQSQINAMANPEATTAIQGMIGAMPASGVVSTVGNISNALSEDSVNTGTIGGVAETLGLASAPGVEGVQSQANAAADAAAAAGGTSGGPGSSGGADPGGSGDSNNQANSSNTGQGSDADTTDEIMDDIFTADFNRNRFKYLGPPSNPTQYGFGSERVFYAARGGSPVQDPSGRVRGPGTAKSDSVPAMISKHEYVLPVETISMMGRGDYWNGIRQLEGLRAASQG